MYELTQDQARRLHATIKNSGVGVGNVIAAAGINRNTYYASWLQGRARMTTHNAILQAFQDLKKLSHDQDN